MGTTYATTQEGRQAIRDHVAMMWDGGDLQGSTLGTAFDICDTLAWLGVDVPAECGYTPGPMLAGKSRDDLDEEFGRAELAALLADGDCEPGDLQYWARVLVRYQSAVVVPAGRDY